MSYEDITVNLTRALQHDDLPIEVEVQIRRALNRALGWTPCDEDPSIAKGICECDSLGPIEADYCTAMWSGCETCNQNHLTYLEGQEEYNVCRACHAERRCTGEFACGPDDCEVFPAELRATYTTTATTRSNR